MNMSLYPRRSRGHTMLLVVGWLLLLGLGVGLTWYGFVWSEESEQPEDTPVSVVVSSPTSPATGPPIATLPPSPTSPSAATPTDTPLPPPTLEPTPIPATETPVPPYIVAGDDGVNVRTGPDTSYERLGYLDPGAQAELIGRDGDWWQIRYDDTPAWVYGPLVTAFNADRIESPTATPSPDEPAPAADAADWADEVFQLINQMRAERGLAPYTRNDALELAAQLHGQESAQRGELIHTGSDGSDVRTRVERVGYEAVGVSEITVTGNSSKWAVDWWMDETPPDDPHRSAILSTEYADIGVAVVPAGDTHYFIAIIAQPK